MYAYLGILVVSQIMHAPTLMKFLGLHETLAGSPYLLRYVKFTEFYERLYEFHQFSAAMWIVIGGIQRWITLPRSNFGTIVHKFLGYLYVTMAILSPICGLLMLLYQPSLIGGSMTLLVLVITAFQSFYSIYRMITAIRKKDIVEHRRWGFRNWYISVSSIQSAVMVTLAAYFGVQITASTYRVILTITMIVSVTTMELTCRYLII